MYRGETKELLTCAGADLVKHAGEADLPIWGLDTEDPTDFAIVEHGISWPLGGSGKITGRDRIDADVGSAF